MVEFITAVKLCFGIMVYYTIYQVYSDFVRSGMIYNTPNRTISELRTKYQVTIKTFQKNNALHGFSWLKSIYINENAFKDKEWLLFCFHHEYYHLNHAHKLKVLLMRFAISLYPLMLVFIPWYFFLVILLASARLIKVITDGFEDKADEYAEKMLADEGMSTKRKR